MPNKTRFLAHEERNTFFRNLQDVCPTVARKRELAMARRLRHLASLANRDDLGLARGKGTDHWINLAASHERQAA